MYQSPMDNNYTSSDNLLFHCTQEPQPRKKKDNRKYMYKIIQYELTHQFIYFIYSSCIIIIVFFQKDIQCSRPRCQLLCIQSLMSMFLASGLWKSAAIINLKNNHYVMCPTACLEKIYLGS